MNIIDSKFYKKDPRFSFQLCKYSFPKKKEKVNKDDDDFFKEVPESVVFNHDQGMKSESKKWSEVFEQDKGGIYLRLLYKKDSHSATRIVKKVQLPFEKFKEYKYKPNGRLIDFVASNAQLEVSEDSKYLGIY